MVAVRVDGITLECSEGTSIMDAAAQVGIEIPSLCYLKGYPAQSSCSLCLVQVTNKDGLVLACSTKVSAGMEVHTESPTIAEARKTCLELLFSDHAGACVGNCTNACPADLAISGFLDQVENGNHTEALRIVRQSLALPAILGHVCAGYCESACMRKHVDKPISIREMHGTLAEADLAKDNPEMPTIAPSTGKRAAIIGAGPTGLSAAFYLLQQGHAVVVHDINPEAGGLMRYAMDEALLPRVVLDREIQLIAKMGASFKLGWRLATVEQLEALRRDFDVILVATGANTAKKNNVNEFFASLGSADEVSVDKHTGLTSRDGIFAAGEIVDGTSKIVRTVAAGRAVAASMHQFIEHGSVTAAPQPFLFRSVMTPEERDAFFDIEPAKRLSERPSLRATDTPAVTAPEATERLSVLGHKTKTAAEASRCLDCSCVSYDYCKLRIYAARYNVNEKRFAGVRRTLAVDRSHPEVDYEPGKCILCGLCILVAEEAGEAVGLGYSGRGFDVRLTLPFGEGFATSLGKSARRCAEICPVGAITLKQKIR